MSSELIVETKLALVQLVAERYPDATVGEIEQLANALWSFVRTM